MITYYTKRSSSEEFEALQHPIESGMWLDGVLLTETEINQLVREYQLSGNIVRDVRDRQELPRVESAPDGLYIFVRLPHLAKSGHMTALPLLVVLRETLLLTMTQGDGLQPEALNAISLPTTTTHTNELFVGVLAAVIGEYEQLLHHTERGINDIANRLRTHEVTTADFLHFVVVEDNLNGFRMNLGGILTVVERLQNGYAQFPHAELGEALDDIALEIKQLLVAVESYVSRVESIRSAHSTIADTKLNQRMKTLTVLTVMITLPNVFFGMYGMNVVLPWGTQWWAYAGVMAVTTMAMAVVYIVAKRLKIF